MMNKAALIFCILMITTCGARADDLAMAAATVDVTHTLLSGVVKSVSWADTAKGTKSEMVVMDAAKTPVHILITSTTTLWDADAKAIMMDKLSAPCRVNVIYSTTPEGLNIGKSIKILQ